MALLKAKKLSAKTPNIVLVFLIVAAVTFFAAVIFYVLYVRGSYGNPSLSAGYQDSQSIEQARLGLPARLTIPKIGVDAAVEHVGLTPQGIMASPDGPVPVAWFDLGPWPGQVGSAVIAGHEGWKDGIAAAFDNLYKVQKGDKVYIQDEQGATTTFVVVGIRTYDQNGDASNVFGSSDGKAHLNLITCEGTWNAAQKSYSNRLVVFTDEE